MYSLPPKLEVRRYLLRIHFYDGDCEEVNFENDSPTEAGKIARKLAVERNQSRIVEKFELFKRVAEVKI